MPTYIFTRLAVVEKAPLVLFLTSLGVRCLSLKLEFV
jgi:hypothetical protein